jgi:hypothetical protein
MHTPLIHLNPFIINESRDPDCPYRASFPWDLYLKLLLLWRRGGDSGLYVCCFGHITIVCCSSMRGESKRYIMDCCGGFKGCSGDRRNALLWRVLSDAFLNKTYIKLIYHIDV